MTKRFTAPKTRVFLRLNNGASNIAGGIVRLRAPPFRKRERGSRPSAHLGSRRKESVGPVSGEGREKPGGEGAPEDKEGQGEKDPLGEPPVDAEPEVDRDRHEDDGFGQDVPRSRKERRRGNEGDELVEEGDPPIGKEQDQEQVGKDSHRITFRFTGRCMAHPPVNAFHPRFSLSWQPISAKTIVRLIFLIR